MKRLIGWMTLALSRSSGGARLMSKIGHHVDRIIFRWTKGRHTYTSWMTGLPVVMLESVGRKSGTVRLIPLVGVPALSNPDGFYLIASNWGQAKYPGWYYNLKAAGGANCTIDGDTRSYDATELDGDAYEAAWEHIVSFLPNYASYKRTIAGARHIPVFEMTLRGEV